MNRVWFTADTHFEHANGPTHARSELPCSPAVKRGWAPPFGGPTFPSSTRKNASIANNATGHSIVATQWRSANLALAANNGAEILLVIRLGNARTSRLTLKDFWNKNAPDRYGKALGNLPDT